MQPVVAGQPRGRVAQHDAVGGARLGEAGGRQGAAQRRKHHDGADGSDHRLGLPAQGTKAAVSGRRRGLCPARRMCAHGFALADRTRCRRRRGGDGPAHGGVEGRAVGRAWPARCPTSTCFIDHGDPIRNMVLHRAETPCAVLADAVLAAVRRRWWRGCTASGPQWRRWWLAMWLALVTHPLLDAMTVYGTQLALPFTDHPYGVGSVFIIDPLYTLPLLVGVGWALRATRQPARPALPTRAGLVLSTAYLGLGRGGAAAGRARGARVAGRAGHRGRARAGHADARSTRVLWRVVAMTRDAATTRASTRCSTASRAMRFDRFDARHRAGAPSCRASTACSASPAFSQGFYSAARQGDRVLLITDLRMGQEPTYIFTLRRSPSARQRAGAAGRARAGRRAGPTSAARCPGCGGARSASRCRRRADASTRWCRLAACPRASKSASSPPPTARASPWPRSARRRRWCARRTG